MPDQYAAPIDHTLTSAAATTALGAAGGAVKTGFKWGAVWTGLAALAGIGAGVAFAGFGFPILGALAGFGIFFGGISTSTFPGVLGSAFGGVMGAIRGHRQVNDERASAAMLQAQVEAYKAQAVSQAPTTNIYAPSAVNDNKFGFPAQGDTMNMAKPSVQTGNDSMQYNGVLAGQQLAAAR